MCQTQNRPAPTGAREPISLSAVKVQFGAGPAGPLFPARCKCTRAGFLECWCAVLLSCRLFPATGDPATRSCNKEILRDPAHRLLSPRSATPKPKHAPGTRSLESARVLTQNCCRCRPPRVRHGTVKHEGVPLRDSCGRTVASDTAGPGVPGAKPTGDSSPCYVFRDPRAEMLATDARVFTSLGGPAAEEDTGECCSSPIRHPVKKYRRDGRAV